MADGRMGDGVPVLVTGAHRLAAAQLLGWDQIECVDADDDPVSAELWELAENLYRLDLTKAERDAHIRRYAELLEERRTAEADLISRQNDAKLKTPENPKGAGRPEGIARQVAEETGLSVRTVQRALRPETLEAMAPPPPNPHHALDLWMRRMNALWAEGQPDWQSEWLEARRR